WAAAFSIVSSSPERCPIISATYGAATLASAVQVMFEIYALICMIKSSYSVSIRASHLFIILIMILSD
ncbi:hypothetical protein NUU60_23085, partial [Leclercia adecarboxylata]|uniref:hypothetical protein n=1 Tax=Leclercia adecarboxylata TaxID=83655 RepID=UPI0021E6FCC6